MSAVSEVKSGSSQSYQAPAEESSHSSTPQQQPGQAQPTSQSTSPNLPAKHPDPAKVQQFQSGLNGEKPEGNSGTAETADNRTKSLTPAALTTAVGTNLDQSPADRVPAANEPENRPAQLQGHLADQAASHAKTATKTASDFAAKTATETASDFSHTPRFSDSGFSPVLPAAIRGDGGFSSQAIDNSKLVSTEPEGMTRQPIEQDVFQAYLQGGSRVAKPSVTAGNPVVDDMADQALTRFSGADSGEIARALLGDPQANGQPFETTRTSIEGFQQQPSSIRPENVVVASQGQPDDALIRDANVLPNEADGAFDQKTNTALIGRHAVTEGGTRLTEAVTEEVVGESLAARVAAETGFTFEGDAGQRAAAVVNGASAQTAVENEDGGATTTQARIDGEVREVNARFDTQGGFYSLTIKPLDSHPEQRVDVRAYIPSFGGNPATMSDFSTDGSTLQQLLAHPTTVVVGAKTPGETFPDKVPTTVEDFQQANGGEDTSTEPEELGARDIFQDQRTLSTGSTAEAAEVVTAQLIEKLTGGRIKADDFHTNVAIAANDANFNSYADKVKTIFNALQDPGKEIGKADDISAWVNFGFKIVKLAKETADYMKEDNKGWGMFREGIASLLDAVSNTHGAVFRAVAAVIDSGITTHAEAVKKVRENKAVEQLESLSDSEKAQLAEELETARSNNNGRLPDDYEFKTPDGEVIDPPDRAAFVNRLEVATGSMTQQELDRNNTTRSARGAAQDSATGVLSELANPNSDLRREISEGDTSGIAHEVVDEVQKAFTGVDTTPIRKAIENGNLTPADAQKIASEIVGAIGTFTGPVGGVVANIASGLLDPDSTLRRGIESGDPLQIIFGLAEASLPITLAEMQAIAQAISTAGEWARKKGSELIDEGIDKIKKNPESRNDIVDGIGLITAGTVVNGGGEIVGGIDNIRRSAAQGGVNFFTRRSDRRLKTDILPLGTHPTGVALYSWRYINDDPTRYVGVMAQDLLADPVRRDAVKIMSEGEFAGYYAVRYDKLGLNMMTEDEWVKQNNGVSFGM